jgi:hypothetical protein
MMEDATTTTTTTTDLDSTGCDNSNNNANGEIVSKSLFYCWRFIIIRGRSSERCTYNNYYIIAGHEKTVVKFE